MDNGHEKNGGGRGGECPSGLFEAFAETRDDGVVVTERSGDIVFANSAARVLLGGKDLREYAIEDFVSEVTPNGESAEGDGDSGGGEDESDAESGANAGTLDGVLRRLVVEDDAFVEPAPRGTAAELEATGRLLSVEGEQYVLVRLLSTETDEDVQESRLQSQPSSLRDELTEAISQADGPQALREAVCDRLVTPFTAVWFSRYDPVENVTEILASSGLDETPQGYMAEHEAATMLTKRATLTKRPQQQVVDADEMSDAARGVDEFSSAPTHQTVAAIPLVAGEELHGIVGLCTDDASLLDETLLSDIGDRVALGLQTVKLDRRHQSLVDEAFGTTLDVGVVVLDEENDVAWVNTAVETFFGIDRTRLVGVDTRRLAQQYLCHTLADSEGYIDRVHRMSDVATVESVAPTRIHVQCGASREERYLRHECHPVESGTYAGGRVELFYDVTGVVRSSAAAETHQRSRQRLVSNLPGLAYRTKNSPKWPFEEVGGEVEELCGYGADAFLSGDVNWGTDVIHPEDRETVWREIQPALERREQFELTYRIRTKDGSVKWVRERGSGVYTDGELDALEGFIADVTERHEAREGLREERDTLRTELDEVFERITDGFFAVNTDWEMTYLNQRAAELLGVTRSELLGTTLWDEFSHDAADLFRERCHEAMETGDPVFFTAEYPELDAWFEVRAFPSDSGLSVHFRDITEERTREKQLARRVEQQDTLARLSREAVEIDDFDVFAQSVCRAVSETLDTDYSKVLELDDAGESLVVRAGVGWRDGIVGDAAVEANANSQAGFTLDHRDPVVVTDLSNEERFSGPELLTSHDVESGMSVVIGPFDDPWGILGTHDTAAQTFSDDDAKFLESVASLVSSVVDRLGRESELERYETIIETVEDGIYGVDPDNQFTFVNEAYCRLVEQDRERLLGADVSRVVGDPQVAERVAQIEQELVEGEREMATVQAEIEMSDGVRVLEATFTLVESATHAYERIGVVRDVTERVEYERSLEARQQELDAVNNIHRTVQSVATAALDTSSRAELEELVCEELASVDRYDSAWVADVGHLDEQVFEPRATSGIDEAAIQSLVTTLNDAGATPIADAWEARESVVHRLDTDDVADEAEAEGLHSLLVIPLGYDRLQHGVLVIHLTEELPDTEGRSILTNLGSLLGYIVTSLLRKEGVTGELVTELRLSLDAPVVDESLGGSDSRLELGRSIVAGNDTLVQSYTVTGFDASDIPSLFPDTEGIEVTETDERTGFVEYAADSTPEAFEIVEHGGWVNEMTVDATGVSLSASVPQSLGVRTYLELLESAYDDVSLVAQQSTTTANRSIEQMYDLLDESFTTRQRGALSLAVSSGYFEWPRGATATDLAEVLDVAPATFSQHLRAAERKTFNIIFDE